MTLLYLLVSPLFAIGGAVLLAQARRHAAHRRRRVTAALYFIGACWLLSGVTLLLYGILGVQ